MFVCSKFLETCTLYAFNTFQLQLQKSYRNFVFHWCLYFHFIKKGDVLTLKLSVPAVLILRLNTSVKREQIFLPKHLRKWLNGITKRKSEKILGQNIRGINEKCMLRLVWFIIQLTSVKISFSVFLFIHPLP